ncbi:hypothetical protein QY97_00016 [Bacillus thermotolerans]|uniref:Uncharacterized protein n=1 Tax=Bacillus thermotolerans TaxID=1221996 RepID=A0A0F5I0D4_BACTR|nr:hypothetical protein QY97_00016 [Bacillus thermotolerans]KKB42734.1 hypothetical protein QY95_03755 [Bacillus thermotolerans]
MINILVLKAAQVFSLDGFFAFEQGFSFILIKKGNRGSYTEM